MKKNFTILVLVVSLSCFVANYFMLSDLQKIWSTAQKPLFDFRGQWALCAYTLHSIDPYAITGLKTPLIEEIGIIPAIWSTTPWGLILGNFFYPGFLNVGDAAQYFWVLNLLILLITGFVLRNHFRFGAIILPAFLGGFLISAYFGNAGAVICCLLILSCLWAEELPILAGVLLSLAMIKPQIALPICFAMLLKKYFKVLVVAALIDFAAWGIAALITNQTPINLLTEFLSINTGGGVAFAGLFTLAFTENLSLAMGLSMLAGILFIWLTFRDEKFFWACPACLATTFFAYSFHNEFFILILPALFCIDLAARTDSKIFWLSAFAFMSWGVFVLFLILGDFWLTRTIFALIMILIGFLMAKNF